ncbi:asparagine synthase (glutamine-hydrolyzing) [Magnetospirillum molischianum]|uniref:asparagine synthase (glutamine-hydrolyzing) n=1 Tax=Magnetospirillum molischianum DSM 120 TaxID=1150626 RepID=H8FXG3_MAGML|nr:asparagine synthase (glutamine-hydrolyzing) [Magnetospirillum molischianum]CCG43051.1 Asparagine synthase (Glutamine-hydrolyzing) [Magnetospirillum molischianum DSM 120]
MCGIAGFRDVTPRAAGNGLGETARAMGDAIRHRGPDDWGVWTDDAAGLALSHRRLSILDLSPAGHQPMVSACGRFVIAYNGEVYNHQEMRQKLEGRGIVFRGHSDTEVIVEACAAWGVEHTVKALIGMFAIALWDRQTRCLTLVRDRLGIKPLYWAKFGGLFLFGSELKALIAHPGWTAEINRDAVSAFLRHNYVPSPLSIYQGVHKLSPGCILTVRDGAEPDITRFWDARQVVGEAVRNRSDLSDAEATDQLEALLKDAVGRRMIADVRLGAFLSGGIDSSTVVALMQAQSSQPVRTFSIGFNEKGYDEAQHAKAVATHLGTEHTELYVDPQHALDIIPRLPEWYDEPFADSSQIPTFLVSEMTRKHVTVALSGDGGDELFAGYNRYEFADSVWSKLKAIPRPLRRLGAAALKAVPPRHWDSLFSMAPARFRRGQMGDKLHKGADVLLLNDGEAFYRRLVSHWTDPDSVVVGGHEPKGILWTDEAKTIVPDFVERLQFLDLVTYLPDDILTKVDRASMAVALEARVPLIDHRVVDFAFRLPRHMKRRNGQGKWLLRQVLYRHVPKELVERPKMGFGVPIDAWLRGPLREWAEDLLSEASLRNHGLVDAAPIRAMWAEHLSGTRNWQYLLWDILMLQAWKAKYH